MKTKLTLLMLALVALAASAATQVARRAAADPINAAIEAAKDGVVTVYLDEDLTLTEPITVPLGKQLVINGRNHTLTLGSGTNFVINDNLTLNNVKIDATELTKPLIALTKEPASGTPKNQDVYKDAATTDFNLLNAVTINGIMVKNLKVQFISSNGADWALENFTLTKSVIQLDATGKNFIDFSATANSKGAIKNITISENTIYNINATSKAYFICYANASNAQKAFGVANKTSIFDYKLTKNTIINTFKADKFGNQTPNNGKTFMEGTQNIYVDLKQPSKFFQGNCTKTIGKNVSWGGTEEATMSEHIDKLFNNPTTALDLTQRKGGIDLYVSESSKAAEYESGDPRWLPRDEYLYTLDFASLTDEDFEAVPSSIDGIAINDEVSDAVVTITGSGNKYTKGEAVALEMNGGTLEFTAPEGSMIQNIFIDFEEWNEGNTAEGVEPTISVDAEKKQAVINDATPVVKLNIAGKTVIKNIFVELSTRSDKIVIDAPTGASLNKLVDDAYAENPYVGQITMNLEKDGKYTVDGALFVNCPLYINGAEGVEIDAAASNAPFILMRPLPEMGLSADGVFGIKGIVIKDVKITGLKNRLFYADRQNYLIDKLAVENSVIQLDGTTPRSIFDFYCGGNYKELSIEGSTLYADPSNAMRGGLVSTQASKSIIEMGGESQKLSIKKSTLYNIAYGKTPVLQQRHSQYYLSFELTDNVIVNCGEKGNFVAGLNEGQKSSEVKWAVANNVFNFDGEDTGKQEAYGNAIPSVVDFADAAKGNFTLSALNAAFQRGIGDPRWLVPGEGSVLIKAKDGSDLTALLEEAAGDKIPNVVVIKLDKNATVTVSKPIVFANSLYIDVPESDILSPASATIDASGLEGPMITTPAETPEEWVTGSVTISDVNVKGLKNALFASAAKNYFYETFAIMGCVVEQAGDATTLDFTKGSVAKDLLISLSTFYAPTATTKSFYSSQSGQKATEYNEGIQQRFAIFGSTMYNLAKDKNFFSHRQSNQKWLVYSVQNNIFVNCGKSGQVIKGINGGQQGTNPTWIVANNIFNFDGEDTSAKEETGDADEPVKGSAAGVMAFNSVETPDFGGVFTLAEGAAKPDAIGDVYHWTVTYNEIVTGIEAVKTAEDTNLENAVIYNLNGQRIDKAQAKSGVFIVNGKKVVIK